MRQQFANTMADLMKTDERLVTLLGDIGVHGFRQVFKDHPERIYNMGILEQSTISAAAGLAMTGLIPVVHTITPFLVERGYEQLKLDFGYQKLGGNFVSQGASYDYAALGCTHHCPADVPILKQIPGMSIVVPGTAKEFDSLFKEAYARPAPTYYRLSETSNPDDHDVTLGKAIILQEGSDAIVIVVGPMLGRVQEAVKGLKVTVLYCTTVQPFDSEALRSIAHRNAKIILCEPYYMGALSFDVANAMKPYPFAMEHIGVPHEFLTNYGTAAEHDDLLGLTAPTIREKILAFIRS